MARHRNDLYDTRPVTDIKDLLYTSADLFGERSAFLVKDRPGGPYRPITFSQLRKDMDSLGAGLLDLGLMGKKIAVIGENRYEWALTYFAVTGGVGVIVPLDRELPKEEIHNLLKRAGASAVVYSGKVGKAAEEAAAGVESLEYLISMDLAEEKDGRLSLRQVMEAGEELIDNGSRAYIDTKVDPEAMNMLLFTSGTTGLAKGVMLSHKNIVANVVNMSKYVNVSGRTGLSVLPMHHTYEMTCHVLTGMYQGCCIAICEGLKHIVKNLAESKTNVMLGVPLIFESMHKKVWKQAEKSGKAKKMRNAVQLSKTLKMGRGKTARKLFKQVHETLGGQVELFIVGAAAIDPLVVEDFCAMGLNMIQGYGMTENSPIIAVNMDHYSKAASVGLPMPGTEIQIIEKDDSGIGEIICRGDSVMLGYYDDPEQTGEVLKDGWLYTGDYGYFDSDGFLYVTGRKKNVIVTKNGKNIFPEEVEYYLNKSGYIAEVMVYGLEDKNTGETVVCADIFPDYETIKEDLGELSEKELQSLMKKAVDDTNDRMPLYKRVKRFDLRETEFEKTTTRKIKRHMVEHRNQN